MSKKGNEEIKRQIPLIVVGSDGTGKTTFCKDFCEKHGMNCFHYTRENAKHWLEGDRKWAKEMAQYHVFDRHPVIDWPVYEYAFGNMTKDQIAEWIETERVQYLLSYAGVLWFKHKYVQPSVERGDLPEAVQFAEKVDEGYELFFELLKQTKVPFNVYAVTQKENDSNERTVRI